HRYVTPPDTSRPWLLTIMTTITTDDDDSGCITTESRSYGTHRRSSHATYSGSISTQRWWWSRRSTESSGKTESCNAVITCRSNCWCWCFSAKWSKWCIEATAIIGTITITITVTITEGTNPEARSSVIVGYSNPTIECTVGCQ